MTAKTAPRKKPKAFDAIAFKEEMQRLAMKRMKNVAAKDIPEYLAKSVEKGPFAKWAARIPQAKNTSGRA